MFATMSGEHARHMNEGITCSECRDPVAIAQHVNGREVVATDFTRDAAQKRCSGRCHLRLHVSEAW